MPDAPINLTVLSRGGGRLPGLDRLIRSLPQHQAWDGMFRKWAVRYLAAMRERYLECAQGGGDWKPDDPKTLIARARRPIGRVREAHRAGEITGLDAVRRMKFARAKVRSVLKKMAAGTYVANILIDTGTLLKALTPGAPGCLIQREGNKVTVGFDGSAPHGGAKGKLTIGKLAHIHHYGEGNCPARRILRPVESGSPLHQAMIQDAATTVRTILTR